MLGDIFHMHQTHNFITCAWALFGMVRLLTQWIMGEDHIRHQNFLAVANSVRNVFARKEKWLSCICANWVSKCKHLALNDLLVLE